MENFNAADPRLIFLTEAEHQDSVSNYDLFHIDFIDGETVITVNKQADYHRVLFMMEKGAHSNATELYLTSLVVALRYVDGTVNNVYVNMSIFDKLETARADIKELFAYMEAKPDLKLLHYDIIINGQSRGYINLDQLDNSELTDYSIVAWRVETCRVIRG